MCAIIFVHVRIFDWSSVLTLCNDYGRQTLLYDTTLKMCGVMQTLDFILLEPCTMSPCYTSGVFLPAIFLKGNSHQKICVANMIELLLKSFLVYHSPMFEAWKVSKRPVEVSYDVTQHLVAHWTAVGTRTNSSGMRTHTGQYSRLPCMHTLIFA